MIKPGQSERLRVSLDQADPNPGPVLTGSSMLQIVEGDDALPELWVSRTADGWEISNDTNRALARLKLDLPASPERHTAAIEQAHWALRNGLDCSRATTSYSASPRTATIPNSTRVFS